VGPGTGCARQTPHPFTTNSMLAGPCLRRFHTEFLPLPERPPRRMRCCLLRPGPESNSWLRVASSKTTLTSPVNSSPSRITPHDAKKASGSRTGCATCREPRPAAPAAVRGGWPETLTGSRGRAKSADEQTPSPAPACSLSKFRGLMSVGGRPQAATTFFLSHGVTGESMCCCDVSRSGIVHR